MQNPALPGNGYELRLFPYCQLSLIKMGKELFFVKGKIGFEKGANSDVVTAESPMGWRRSPGWSDPSFPPAPPRCHTDPAPLSRPLGRKATLNPGRACSSLPLHSSAAGAVLRDTGTHSVLPPKMLFTAESRTACTPPDCGREGATKIGRAWPVHKL